MPDYDIYWEGSLGEEQVLWHFDEELINETVDDDCEIWGFHVLVEQEEAA